MDQLNPSELHELQLAELPETMRVAQRAVQTPEVQGMIRQLAEYNLGVCMPHMHPEAGEFVDLPADMVSLEQKSSFIPKSDVDPVNTLPVSWHWKGGEVTVAGSCHILQRKCD